MTDAPGLDALLKLSATLLSRAAGTTWTPTDAEALRVTLSTLDTLGADLGRFEKAFGEDLSRIRGGVTELRDMLAKVAAEPVPPPGRSYAGTPLHLLNRAITADSATWGSA